jgi:hypothetical protein
VAERLQIKPGARARCGFDFTLRQLLQAIRQILKVLVIRCLSLIYAVDCGVGKYSIWEYLLKLKSDLKLF